MGALARRGLRVAPFKVGPDYIDPTYHALSAGRPSRNLDTWLMPASEMEAAFARGLAVAGPGEVAGVVEGVMGLFDGLAGGGERCSTAEVAKLLDLPVFLVVDTSSMARSVAALVHGFRTFDSGLRLAGVILNKVASSSHAAMLREALGDTVPVVGIVPRRSDLHLTSRHLGLIPTVENPEIRDVLESIVDHVQEHVDLDALLEQARTVPLQENVDGSPGEAAAGSGGPANRPRVAVARDSAFSFYYQDNLEALEEAGADVVFFSPLAGDPLPACEALYLGGGYPEVYAEGLAANTTLRRDLVQALAGGLRLYAECGGYLYLGEEIEYEGERHTMAGILPTQASLAAKRLRMGYVEAEALAGPLAGAAFRGHLFHYSATTVGDLDGPAGAISRLSPAYRVTRKAEVMTDGLAGAGLVASYVHLHFRGSRAVAEWLARGEAKEG
jgi:cobyrinic acid a,c-diamide synthase